MKADELRKSILQLAIQGKLVKQDPNDEPASILIEKIRKEKQRLIKEGKIKKDKTESFIYKGADNSYYEKISSETRCIDKEIPFEVPEGWEWCRVKNISQSYIGLTYSPSEVVQTGGIIVLRSSNIQNGQICFNDIVRVNKAISEKLFVSANDIIICARNGSKKLVGKSALIDKIEEPTTFGAFMAICKTSLYQYVSCFLQSDCFFNQLHQVSGTTTVNQLTQDNFNNFLIPIPPFKEQKRIIKQIENFEPLLVRYDKLEQQQSRLETEFPEKLKKSILQYAIQGKLVAQNSKDEPASVLLDKIQKEKEQLIKEGKIKRNKNESVIYKNTDDNSYYEIRNGAVLCIDEEIPFEIPDNWEWVRLGSIGQHNTGKTLDKVRNKGALREYITTSNLYWGHFDLNKLKQMPFQNEELDRCTAVKGDLLICEGGEAGRSAIWNFEKPICFQNHIHRVRLFANISSQYLLYYMEKIYLTGEINVYRRGVGIQSLSGNSLASILIPLPPLLEQKRIVEQIEKLFTIFLR